MIVFKVMLIILVALPAIIFAAFLFTQLNNYIKKQNSRDRRRTEPQGKQRSRAVRRGR